MTQLRADFVDDLQALAEDELRRRGISRPKAKGMQKTDALCRLLTVEHRLVPPRRRLSIWSDVLQNRRPDKWLEAASRIAGESESGADLSHYLSRGVRNAEADRQLNDSGITHFHLGKRQPGKLLSEGTKELLFVIPTVESLYLVDIGDHSSFDDASLFETVHRNWPVMLSGSRAHNVVPGSYSLTPERAARLRRAGFVTLTQTQDGTVYNPHGLGQMANGLSARVRIQADQMGSRVRDFQNLCQDGLAIIVAEAAKFGVFLPGNVDLRLIEVGAALIAKEVDGRFWLSLDARRELRLSNRHPSELLTVRVAPMTQPGA